MDLASPYATHLKQPLPRPSAVQRLSKVREIKNIFRLSFGYFYGPI
jgi:hypothetical protein